MDPSLLSSEHRQVGPYVLLRRLGAGGMGEVWAGRRTHETGASKSVAVKLLTPERAHDEASLRMFGDEARLSMLLCNSNIVQVFDVGEDEGVHYMAMEWVDGLNLDELCKATREDGQLLPLPVVGYIVGEILKGLAYAHDYVHEGQHRTIVHRDISAHNVMISVAGEVKLMDFGIARVASEETSGVHVKGKLRYMPPEQLRGDSRAPTIDLFAVGAILHELLEGKRFRSGVVDEARLYGMVLDGETPALSCPPGRVPRELDVLRLGLLQAKAEQRIPSAREAHRYLSRWPGYRDAKFELQDLLRSRRSPHATRTEFVAPPAPRHDSRSHPVHAPRASTPTPPSRAPFPSPTRPPQPGVPTQVYAQESSSLPPAPESPGTDPSLERTRPSGGYRAVGGASTGTELVHTGTAPIHRDIARPQPDTASALRPELLLILAVGLPTAVVLMCGALVAWLVLRADSAPPVEIRPALVTPASQPTPTPPEPIARPEAVGAAPSPVDTTPDIEAPKGPGPAPGPEPEPSPKPEPEPAPKAKLARVPVTIMAPSSFWIEIEIAGRVYALDRMGGKTKAHARLRPGTHRVRYRSSAGGSWTKAKAITIPKTQERLALTWQKSGRFLVQ